ncbi:MAG: tetratricopeptide repeat protein [Microscillaceae bacterium]|nr:tetratricopeptide repeat protein [Microscillaceae bacterium]
MNTRLGSFLCFLIVLYSICPVFSQPAKTYLSSGKQKLAEGVFTEAVDDFSEAIRYDNQSSEAYFNRAEAYYELRRYDEALRDYSKSIQLEPENAMSWFQRGLTYAALHKTELAYYDFSTTIERNGRFEAAYVERANLHRLERRYKFALRDCEDALKINPNFAPALSMQGLVKLDQGNINQALVDLRQAVKLDPANSDLRSNLADYYQRVGQNEKAVEEYTAAVNLNPHNPKAFCNRALLKLSLGNYEDALKDANRSIYNNRRYQEAYAIRGIAFYNTGEMDRYDRDFNLYLSQAAENHQDYYNLASKVFEYAEVKDNNSILIKAEGWAQKAIQLNNNYENNLLLANILFKLKRNTFAKLSAEKAVEIARSKSQDPSHAQFLIAKIDQEYADRNPPLISITSPATSTRGVIVVEETQTITVIGNVSDESGVDKVLINGNLARLNADGSFDGETTLLGKENIITVRAFDMRGNESAKSFTVVKEANQTSTPPPLLTSSLIGRQKALLFATDTYDSWTNLLNPINDARAIGRDLRDLYGFDVEIAENYNKEQVMLKIKEYAKMSYENNDQLFIFFAGHGQFDDVFKEGYVVASDSKFEDESKSSYIAHSNLKTYINSIPCRHIFLVMDVCFGGTFDREVALRGEGDITSDREELINRKMRYIARKYLTSGGKEYVPDGRAGQHSPFVRKFLEALRAAGGKDRILTLSEIMEYVTMTNPQPHYGEFGTSEPGSDFLFIAR